MNPCTTCGTSFISSSHYARTKARNILALTREWRHTRRRTDTQTWPGQCFIPPTGLRDLRVPVAPQWQQELSNCCPPAAACRSLLLSVYIQTHASSLCVWEFSLAPFFCCGAAKAVVFLLRLALPHVTYKRGLFDVATLVSVMRELEWCVVIVRGFFPDTWSQLGVCGGCLGSQSHC